MTINPPLLIAGAGPVGLSLALALARQHLPVEIFEADPELNTEIRASTFHPRTLEMFAEWGVVDEFLAQGHRVDRLQYWERAPRRLIAEFDYALIANDTPYPFRLQCPQHLATRILKPAVEAAGGKVHMAHRLVDLTHHESRVTATFETPNGLVHRDAAYFIGTDGSRSTTRHLLGLSFEGMTYEDRFLLIGTNPGVSDQLPGPTTASYIFDPEEWVIILNLPDLVRIVFQLRPDEKEDIALAEPALRARVYRFFGENFPFDIRTTQLYRVHQRVAETFRVGRVILAGDAAHLNNPAGGMGMNSGIHDAHLLAATLTRLAHGEPDTLLDHYSQTRRNFALHAVQQYTDKVYRDMILTDPALRHARNMQYAEIAADAGRAREFLLKASMIGGET